MKKLMSVLLLVVMVFSLGISCYAVDANNNNNALFNLDNAFKKNSNGSGLSDATSNFKTGLQNTMGNLLPILGVLAIVIGGGYMAFGHQMAKQKLIGALIGVGLMFGAVLLAGALLGIFNKTT